MHVVTSNTAVAVNEGNLSVCWPTLSAFIEGEMFFKAWRIVSFLDSTIFLRIGWGATGTIPVLATIDSLLAKETYGATYLSRLLHVFEIVPTNLPLNLTRVFWASLLYSSAAILFKATRPEITHMSKKEWVDSSDHTLFVREAIMKVPGIVPAQLEKLASAYFHKKSVPPSDKRNAALLLIYPLMAFSI